MIDYSASRDPSSFRDPAGAVFYQNGEVYRQINEPYRLQYDKLIQSGLYGDLVENNLLIKHETVDLPLPDSAYLIIKPQIVPFISYSYEWCFGQLKDAALATLKIHRRALDYNMILKDASAYNIQFINGRPLLIDTLSFDLYRDGSPWIAYGQFCRHFLAPLFLMIHTDIHLSQLLKIYIDGIPLDIAKNLLGMRGGFGALQHIKWHADAISKNTSKSTSDKPINQIKISKFSHIAMIESLIRLVEKMHIKNYKTNWGDYYKSTNYSPEAAEDKKNTVAKFIDIIKPDNIWDFGANDGTYSRLALINNSHVVAFDSDPESIEMNYSIVKHTNENLLPLLLDLTNPSPALGFANEERRAIWDRQHPDCILALALIHHLAISNNLPLDTIASWLSKLSKYLIIEFVPKNDSQAIKLLSTRDDIFTNYNTQGFESSFSKYYDIIETHEIKDTARTLYMMKSKNN